MLQCVSPSTRLTHSSQPLQEDPRSASRLSSDPPRVAYTATAVASLVHEVRRTRSHEATPADPCRHARPSARAASAASSRLEQHRACAAASRLPSGVARAAARSSRWSGPGTGGNARPLLSTRSLAPRGGHVAHRVARGSPTLTAAPLLLEVCSEQCMCTRVGPAREAHKRHAWGRGQKLSW